MTEKVAARFNTLRERHRALESEINRTPPYVDVSRLKRQKLRIKDEMEALERKA